VAREPKTGSFPAQVFERLSALQTDIDWIKETIKPFSDIQQRLTRAETTLKFHSRMLYYVFGALSAMGITLLTFVLAKI